MKLEGYAQSNARVSTLMRNIEASPWLENPSLVEVKAATVDKKRVSQFELNLAVKRVDKKDAAKDARQGRQVGGEEGVGHGAQLQRDRRGFPATQLARSGHMAARCRSLSYCWWS